MEKVNFAIDKMKILQEVSDDQLALVEVYVCHDNMNAHELPIDIKALKQAESTLFNKFLVAGFDGYDFTNHAKKQLIVGFFPKENSVRYEEVADKDGNIKTYFVAQAIMSKIYATWAYELFLEDNYKEVSMEISVLEKEKRDDGYQWITSYLYNGVTILGAKYTAACEGSNAQVLEFSDLVAQSEKFSLEVEKFSKTADSKEDDVNLSIDEIDVKTAKKEDDRVEKFDKVEFAKVSGITSSEMSNMMYEAASQMKYGEDNWTKYSIRDFCGKYAYAYDYETSKMVAIPYSMSEGKVAMDFENVKCCRMAYVVDDEEEGSEDELMAFAETCMKEKVTKEFEAKISEKESEFEVKITEKDSEFEVKFAEVNKEVETLKAENDNLKQFKSNIEQQVRKDQVDFAIQSVSEKLTQAQIDEWRNKADEFETTERFTEAIKAFAFDLESGKEPEARGFSRIHIPTSNETEKKSGSVWSKL